MSSTTRAPDSAQWDVDRELVARAQAGDAVAFELLVVKYQRRVAALIRSLVRRADSTEELTQEVFINAYDHLADLRTGVAFCRAREAIAAKIRPYLSSTRSRRW